MLEENTIPKRKGQSKLALLNEALEKDTPVEAEALIDVFKDSISGIPEDSLHIALRKGWTTVARAILSRNDLLSVVNRPVTVLNPTSTPIVHNKNTVGSSSEQRFRITYHETQTTPLYHAIRNNPRDILVSLIAKKADISEPLNQNHATVLHFAAQEGWTEVVDACINHPNFEVDIRTKDNLTPLMLAADNGHAEIVEKLLSHKANINAETTMGNRAFSLAINTNHTKVIQTLFASKALRLSHQDGEAMLRWAINNDPSDLHEILLKLLSPPHQAPYFGKYGPFQQSLFLICSRKKWTDVLELMQPWGPIYYKIFKGTCTEMDLKPLNVNEFTRLNGETLLSLARNRIKPEMEALLIANGAATPPIPVPPARPQYSRFTQPINNDSDSGLEQVQSPVLLSQPLKQPKNQADHPSKPPKEPFLPLKDMLSNPSLHEWRYTYSFNDLCKMADVHPQTLEALKLYAHIQVCRMTADPKAKGALTDQKIANLKAAINEEDPSRSRPMLIDALKLHRDRLNQFFNWVAPYPNSYERLPQAFKLK